MATEQNLTIPEKRFMLTAKTMAKTKPESELEILDVQNITLKSVSLKSFSKSSLGVTNWSMGFPIKRNPPKYKNMTEKRGICIIDGCEKQRISCGLRKGKRYFRKYCNKHYVEHYNIKDKIKNRCSNWRKKHPDAYKNWAIKNIYSQYNGLKPEEYSELRDIPCSICGWNKTTCDFHRKKYGRNGGQYTKENIIVLCPNCHRLVHRGLLEI